MTKRKISATPKPVRVALVGSGLMARHHISVILAEFPHTEISVICEPSAANYTAVADQFKAAGKPIPPNEPNF
jgi:ornithine cyclodeaminase/alanine dehydrogenase-like protein (mu-crystallin family)